MQLEGSSPLKQPIQELGFDLVFHRRDAVPHAVRHVHQDDDAVLADLLEVLDAVGCCGGNHVADFRIGHAHGAPGLGMLGDEGFPVTPPLGDRGGDVLLCSANQRVQQQHLQAELGGGLPQHRQEALVTWMRRMEAEVGGKYV